MENKQLSNEGFTKKPIKMSWEQYNLDQNLSKLSGILLALRLPEGLCNQVIGGLVQSIKEFKNSNEKIELFELEKPLGTEEVTAPLESCGTSLDPNIQPAS